MLKLRTQCHLVGGVDHASNVPSGQFGTVVLNPGAWSAWTMDPPLLRAFGVSEAEAVGRVVAQDLERFGIDLFSNVGG